MKSFATGSVSSDGKTFTHTLLQSVTFMCLSLFGTALTAQSAPWTKTYANPAKSLSITEATPLFDLNGSDNLEFTRVRAIVPQSDGSFIVANGATLDLRTFDAKAAFVSRVGRKGNGPGEYTAFTNFAQLRGDSLAVLDGFARRVSILSKDGKFVRSVSVSQSPTGLGSVDGVVALPTGALLVSFNEVTRMAPQPNALTFFVQYFTLNTTTGALAPANIRVPNREHFVQAAPPEAGGVAYWSLAFGKETSVRGTRTGFVVGDAMSWSIEQHASDGAFVGTHRVTRAVQPLSNAERDAYKARTLAAVKGNDGGRTEKMVTEMPYPKNKPTYARVEVERGSDRLWVQAYASDGDTRDEWLRLDPQASVAESLLMPSRFRAFAFTATHVYGVWRDDDDVEHVRVYALPAMRK